MVYTEYLGTIDVRPMATKPHHTSAPDGTFGLSSAQQGVWAAQLLSPESSALVTGQYSEILAALDVAAFELASRRTIEETEALRLCFGGTADRPLQWVAPLGQWSLPIIDLSGEPDPHTAALAWMKSQLALPIEIGSGRAFRWTLLRLGAARYIWSFQVHHLILDGFSRNAVWRRLDEVYSALSAGIDVAPVAPGALRELLARERGYESSPGLDEDRRHFAALLADLPPHVSLSRKPPVAGREFRRATVHLPRDLTTALRALVPGASLAPVVTAAAALLQHGAAGGEDLVLGFAVSARLGALARRTPSMLSNILPLRLSLSREISIEQLVRRTAAAIRGLLPHQRYASLALRQDLQLAPLDPDPYGITVNFMPFDQGSSFGGFPASTHNLSNGPVADLTVGVFDSRGQTDLRIDLNGNRELYREAELTRYLGRLVELLAAMPQEPARRPIGTLLARAPAAADSMAAPETVAPPLAGFLGPRFDAVAAWRGNAVALVDGARQFSYAQLLRRSAALTSALTARGIGPGDRVGVALPRSAEMVIAVVGIVRSGATYVPVDVLHPPDRRALIFADARPRLVVSDGALAGIPGDMEILQLPAVVEDGELAPAVVPSDDDIAYVIYTSGSTGQPNGVRVTQHNISRLFTATQPLYDFKPSDVWSLFHSLAFDVSVFELWGALLTGGRLIVVPASIAKAADAFHELVVNEGVTVLSQTPSAFRAFDTADAIAARPESRLRQVIFAGERLDPRSLKDWFDAHGDQRPQLVNMYGITETTVHSTYRPMRAADAMGEGRSMIGVPLSDLRIELLDADGVAVADGQVGEIWVGGAGVTAGYLERPELTARRFRPDPSGSQGALRYRSGDLARQLPDGDLEYLGRADEQIKLRGFRVELGEIEAMLRQLPSVRDAVVALREDPQFGPTLIAYMVSNSSEVLEPEELRRHLQTRLPEYMMPAAFVRIVQVPRTVNDKIDRKALPAPGERDFPTAADANGGAEGPRDELEQTIADIFAEVLGRPATRRDSDFFRLGGHSLLAVRATLLCQERLEVALPIRSLFEHPTVAGFASNVRAVLQLRRGKPLLVQVARGAPVPLSPQQRALWLDAQLQSDDGNYNVPIAFSTAGRLEAGRLRKALLQLAQTHEVLRGRLGEHAGTPCFWFDRDPAELDLDWCDSLHPAADFAAALRGPFDLLRGPLWRCVVRPQPDGTALFALVLHHLIIDAAGEQILLRDLAAAYAQPDRPPPKRSYDFADLAAYETEKLSADRLKLERFWQGALEGVEAPELPMPLCPCPPGAERTSVRARHRLPPALAARVRGLAAECGTTPFHVYFAVYQALLRLYAARDDLAIGSLVSLRDSAAASGVVGYLLSPVVLRMPLQGTDTFRATVAELARRWQQVSLHARLPMDSLVRVNPAVPRTATGSPYQLFFSLLEEPDEMLRLGECEMTPLDTLPATAKFKLFLQVENRGPATTLALEFQRGALDPESGARLLDHYTTLLQAAVASPDARLCELSVLAPEERATLTAWGANVRPYPKGRTVTDLFEEIARARPKSPALIAGRVRWRYEELDQRANAVAAELCRLGVGRGQHVPLLLPRGAQFVACALGVLKSGAAYVPIDPDLPAERCARLLRGLNAQIGLREGATALKGTLRWLDASQLQELEASPPPRAGSNANDAAYVMFTSGSTGLPKGVPVPHRGIVRLVRGQSYASFGAEESWLQLAPTSFDASSLELWAPLLNGGRCIVVEDSVPTPATLSTVIRREGATSAWLTSSLFNALIDEQPDCLDGLAQILIGGETLSPTHVRRALQRRPGLRLINGYGPTENSTFTCCHAITRADVEPGRTVPIGRPIGNTTVRVLDGDGCCAPIGVPGELVAGGDGVALGYLGLADQTSQRFVPDDAAAAPGALCYRTGDRVRWRSDGTLEFLGRFDQQLKFNGHRIEPGEIAAVLAEHPSVRQAIVVPRTGAAGDTELVAYVVVRDDAAPSDLFFQLARHAAERLPSYMRIACFARIDALPRKPNGKVDAAALPPIELPADSTDARPDDSQPGDAALLALIGELLGQKVSRKDNLYALGADSIRLVRLVARMKSRLGIDLPIGEVTKRGDIADVLRLASEPMAHRRVEDVDTSEKPMDACSPWQTWLWRLQRLDPADATPVVFRAWRAAAPIDADLLERALRELVGRHQALRCRLIGADDADPKLELRPPEELLLQRAAPLREALLGEARTAEHFSPFDLSAQLPIRVRLQPIADRPDESELWVSIHHVAFDGTSEEIFWRELRCIFSNLTMARSPLAGLAPLRSSYLDLVRRQRATLDHAALQQRTRYWQQKLAGAPERVPVSWRAAATQDAMQTCQLLRPLPPALLEGLRQLGRERHISVAMLCLAAFEALLLRWSGEQDQLIALDFAGRGDEAEEDQIGLFTSPIALRMDLSGDPSLLGLANASRALVGDALSHRLPFERLAGALGSGRRRFAGFTIFYGHLTRGEAPSLGGTPLIEVPPELSPERTELRLVMEERPGALSVNLAGAAALYDLTDLERLASAFQGCLAQLCQRADVKLSELEWLSPSDRDRLACWNSTAVQYPRDLPLTSLLRAQATRTPTSIALQIGDMCVTYAELFQRAAELAARLKYLGVGRESRVGLYLDRHATLPQAMLAILEAGGGYVPLDPNFPPERLAFMIEDAQIRTIVTRRALLTALPPHSAQVICVEDDSPVGAPAAGWLPADASSLAYVLYTSGSTGKPKGVEVEHRQLVNFLSSMARCPGMDSSDVLLAVTSITFDIAGLEIWLPLLCGARIWLAGREEIADPQLLQQALTRSGATIMQATPSTWRALFASGWAGNPNFKALVGGEALPADLAQLLAANCGEAWNLYGPTETTIWSSVWRLPAPSERVRVGKPIANTELHVVDASLRPLPIGVPGELFIGGEGVARGYLKRSELTAERFVGDPFRGGGARMYRSGDLARWLPDGTLELLGRNDDQLKLRGHRIEAGEVEHALHRLACVAQAVVTLHRPESGDPRLVAYLVPRTGVTVPPSAELRAELRQWLAEYMLPYNFVTLDALPLTPNGKVDRRRLSLLPLEPDFVAADAMPPAAASAMQAELIAEFSRSLGREVTLDSDFFEAGGDSLGVLRLVSRLSQQLAMPLTSGELFLHSTPRRLAARLEQLVTGPAQPRHLVSLRHGHGPAAVVLVHPMGGHLAPYARLAHHLNASVNLFGLQAAGCNAPPYESIAERCAGYVEELMAKWRGPLILGGYSLGGALAMEMASQLRRAGRNVPVVLLLDAAVPRPVRAGWDKLQHRARELWRFSWHDRSIWLKEQVAHLLGAAREDVRDYGEAGALIDAPGMKLLVEQALRWQPPLYEGKVILFRAERNLRGYPTPRGTLGWDRCCRDLEVRGLECNHAEILVEPQVQRIASVIDSLLGFGTPS